MAVKGMSEFRADGENYTINDPNIANEFSTSAAYAAGDYVYYQGNLYRFTAAHAAGAWAGTDATQVKLGGDVSDLKSAFESEVPIFTNSFVIPANDQHSSSYDAIHIQIRSGEKFYVETDHLGLIVIKYMDDTNENIAALSYTGTASKDIKYIGIYYDNRSSDSAVTIHFVVVKTEKFVDLIKNVISGSGDADSFDKNLCLYAWGTTDTVQHIPASVTIGAILNINGGSEYRRFQILFSPLDNDAYFRVKNGQTSTWGSWIGIANKNDVSHLITDVEGIEESVFKAGKPTLQEIYFDDGTSNQNSGYRASDLIPVVAPVKIRFSANVPSGFHAILAYGASGEVIDTYYENINQENVEFTINNNAVKYIRFQSRALGYTGNTIDPVVYVFYDFQEMIKQTATGKAQVIKATADKFYIKVPCDSGNVVRYEFEHDYKVWDSLSYVDGNGQTQTATNVKSADYWNNYRVYNDTTGDYIAQGNSNFIINKDGHYSGDGHGNERSITFNLLADGKIVDLSSMSVGDGITCGEVKIISKSEMLRVGGNTGEDVPDKAYPALDTSGNPIVDFIHCMEMDFVIGNKVTIRNKLIVKTNNVTLNQCFGAMLECRFGDFSKVICNNAENTENIISSSGAVTVANGSTIDFSVTPSVYANTVEMFGDDFYICQSMLNDNPSDYGKEAITFIFYPNSRLKAYLTPVPTTTRYPGGTPETFNAGDVISVHCERIIDI